MSDRARPEISRRSFLSGAAAFAAGALCGAPAPVRGASLPYGTVRQIWIASSITGEEVRAYLTVDGTHLWRGSAQYPGYDQICWLLRDAKYSTVAAYDVRVLEAVWEIQQTLLAYKHDAPILVTSGFRTPQRNTEVGGALRSYHTRAAALDFVVPGVDLDFLWRVAASREITGGLGWYPRCEHVHLDSGPRRYWADQHPCS